jgi:hypothetical protein
MARSVKNGGTNPKFDADPLAMQRIMARAARGARAKPAAEKSRQDAQSPDASHAFSLGITRALPRRRVDRLRPFVWKVTQAAMHRLASDSVNRCRSRTSALPPRTDIGDVGRDVRFVPTADIHWGPSSLAHTTPTGIDFRQSEIGAPELSRFYKWQGISKTSNPVVSKGN